jgi:hypothetical protein
MLAEYSFAIKGIEFKVGLYPTKESGYPDIYYPALSQKKGGVWVILKERQDIWKDLQEDEHLLISNFRFGFLN